MQRARATNGVEPVDFDELLSCTLERWKHGDWHVPGLDSAVQYPHVMCRFCYDTNDKRPLSKRKNLGRLELPWKSRILSSSPRPRICKRLWSSSLAVSTAIRVVSSACPWRLHVSKLRRYKTSKGNSSKVRPEIVVPSFLR